MSTLINNEIQQFFVYVSMLDSKLQWNACLVYRCLQTAALKLIFLHLINFFPWHLIKFSWTECLEDNLMHEL